MTFEFKTPRLMNPHLSGVKCNVYQNTVNPNPKSLIQPSILSAYCKHLCARCWEVFGKTSKERFYSLDFKVTGVRKTRV